MMTVATQQNSAKQLPHVSDELSIVEQVAPLVNTWASRLGQLINAKALSILCGLSTTQISAGLDELADQQRLRRIGPGIFVMRQSFI